VVWDDLNARARGLSVHLLTRGQIATLAESADLADLAAALERLGFACPPPPTAAALDLGLRRKAAAFLRILSRWCGRRKPALAAVFEDEDRRSLRALLRGAVAGAPAEQRLAGLVPTPELPERALRELARQPSAAAVADLLAVWGNPYGAAIREEASRPYPDLFRLETALNRCFAERAAAAARRGGRELAAYVRLAIDLENAVSALFLADAGPDVPPEAGFLEGGERLSRQEFAAAAGTASRAAAGRRLARSFAGTPFAAVFARPREGVERLEAEILAARLRQQAAAARRRPLGPAPLLSFLLRLRAELIDLRRVVWGTVLGLPRRRLVEGLVTP
jgi:vacuolar-type H+-ATPase subunit C/Vma6